MTSTRIPSLKSRYESQIVGELKKSLKFHGVLDAPRIEKVIINVGVGKISKEDAVVTEIAKEIAVISGQKPILTKAKKAVAGFKIRQGAVVGVTVTIRKKRAWDFLDRLVHIALARIRDFQGISLSAVDAAGNMNIGIKEHIIFPEIKPEKVTRIFSMQVTVKTTAGDRRRGLELFRALGFPIKKQQQMNQEGKMRK